METMETGDRNCGRSQHHVLFCEESLGKIDEKDVKLFWNGWFHEFDHLKALITLEDRSEYCSDNFDGEAINWSGVVNFHCMQMSFVVSMWFISAMIELMRHHIFGL